MASNFEFMKPYSPEIARLGTQAEAALHASDTDVCEALTSRLGRYVTAELFRRNGLLEESADPSVRIALLRQEKIIPESVADILLSLDATGYGVSADGSSRTQAEMQLRLAHKLCSWFVQKYGYQAPDEETASPSAPELSQPEAELTPLLFACVPTLADVIPVIQEVMEHGKAE